MKEVKIVLNENDGTEAQRAEIMERFDGKRLRSSIMCPVHGIGIMIVSQDDDSSFDINCILQLLGSLQNDVLSLAIRSGHAEIIAMGMTMEPPPRSKEDKHVH